MRTIGQLLRILTLSLCGLGAAAAQDYPTRPVRLIAPIAPGGLTDSLARVVAEGLSQRLGQSVFVDNRPGAGGIIGMTATATAAPDGYSLVFVYQGVASVNPVLYKKLPYDTLADFTTIGMIGSFPIVLAVGPNLPVTNAAEFLDLARKRPGELNYGSAGIATTSHLAMELLKAQANVNLTHVAYRGESPAITDVVAGRISALFGTLAVVRPLADSGQLRVLGIATPQPSVLATEIAPLARTVPGYEVSGWYGILAPKGTPEAIVAKLSATLNDFLSDPSTPARLQALGVVPTPASPAAFRALIAAETTKWREVIAKANISVD